MVEKFVEDRLIKEGNFDEIFPKTFSYLEVYVKEVYQRYHNKNIPDPKVEVRLYNPDCHSLNGELLDHKIIIYLDSIASDLYSDKRMMSLTDNDYNRFIKYVDSMPKLKITLIHEYTHYLQDFPNRQEFVLGSNADVTPKKFKYNEKDIQKALGFASKFNGYFSRYGFGWDEIDARLSEWIYLKVKGYDSMTASSLDFAFESLHSEYPRIKSDLEAIQNGIKMIRDMGFFGRFKNSFRYNDLIMLEQPYKEIVSIYEKVDNYSTQVAEMLKRKHSKITRL